MENQSPPSGKRLVRNQMLVNISKNYEIFHRERARAAISFVNQLSTVVVQFFKLEASQHYFIWTKSVAREKFLKFPNNAQRQANYKSCPKTKKKQNTTWDRLNTELLQKQDPQRQKNKQTHKTSCLKAQVKCWGWLKILWRPKYSTWRQCSLQQKKAYSARKGQKSPKVARENTHIMRLNLREELQDIADFGYFFKDSFWVFCVFAVFVA